MWRGHSCPRLPAVHEKPEFSGCFTSSILCSLVIPKFDLRLARG